jgi:multidrug efflux pump subunit AcrA (membrane-fusion protein)
MKQPAGKARITGGMNQAITRLHLSPRRLALPFSCAVIALCVTLPDQAKAQIPYSTATGEMLLCESAGASRVVEKVRSQVQGVMMECYVKTGDVVKKGQLLGNAELDATKFQLDLAQHTMDAKANVDSARSQAEAWAVTREETEEAVRRRKAEKSRLDWATAMEGMYRGTYEAQIETEALQRIQYDYWKQQYDKRFFRASADGVISEVLVEIGKPVNFATHLFTIRDENTFSIPLQVPAELADVAVSKKTLPVRTADGKAVSQAQVDSVTDDPRQTGAKIIRLLVRATDFPAAIRSKLAGMKFGVLLPQVASLDRFVE